MPLHQALAAPPGIPGRSFPAPAGRRGTELLYRVGERLPGRWKGGRATSASNMYALDVLAHELLEGTMPFTGPYEHDFYEQHLHGTPPPLTTAPPLLAALITECLFRAPQGRPTVGNVLERLRRLPASSLSGGPAALAEANRAEAARRGEADRQASAEATEAERRRDLLEAARTSLRFISDQLLTTITNIASTADILKGKEGGWTVRLALAAMHAGASLCPQAARPTPVVSPSRPSTPSPTRRAGPGFPCRRASRSCAHVAPWASWASWAGSYDAQPEVSVRAAIRSHGGKGPLRLVVEYLQTIRQH
ncbi:hypothetical protein [Streptomyces europaeiscabiei]|uniref:hypothetical protein n=1 Tax=Streptomyces europaeiscabiei TaxID=146819 RepID=UPI002E17E31E